MSDKRIAKKNIRATGKLRLCSIVLMFLLVFLGFSHSVHAVGGDIKWQRGDSPPVQAGKQEALAMALDSTGATAVTGYSTQLGTEDYYTIKILADGSGVVWRKTFGHAGGIDRGLAIAVDGNDDIIVTGYTWNGVDNDFYTIKYRSADGVILWQMPFDNGVAGNDYATSITVDGAGDVYVGGYSQNGSNDDYIIIKYNGVTGVQMFQKFYNGSGNGHDRVTEVTAGVNGVAITGSSQNASGDDDCLTIKYDFNLNTVWTPQDVRYNGSGTASDDHGIDVKMDTVGHVVMTCRVYNSDADIYTVKYNSATGAIIAPWPIVHNGGHNDEPSDLWIDSSDNVYVGGWHAYLDGSSGFYAAKHSGGGVLQWEDIYHASSDSNDRDVGIVVDNAGEVYVSGDTYDNIVGNYDFLTAKYTKNTGKLLWTRNFDGAANKDDRVLGLGLSPSGDPIVAGWSDQWTGGASDLDFYSVKYEAGLLNRPTDLTATAVTTSQINLSWSDNSINNDTFRIDRKKGDVGSWVIDHASAGANDTSFPDIGLDSDTKYFYRVRAHKNSPADDSNYSDDALAVTTIVTYTSHADEFKYDAGETNEDKAMSIAVGPNDFNPVATGHSYSALGTFDYYTVKLDRQDFTTPLWSHRLDGDLNNIDFGVAIATDPANDDALVSGWSWMYDFTCDCESNDIFTLEYPSAGPPYEWGKQYNGPANDDDRSVVVQVGSDASSNHFVVGYGINASGNDDIYLIKYDDDGNLVWAATPYDRGVSGDDYPYAMAVDASGDIIIVGRSFNGTDYDLLTVKYDSSGNLDSSWSVNPVFYDSTEGNDYARALTVDSVGDIYMTGLIATSNGNTDIYTVRYKGSDGTIVTGWPQTYNGYADGIDEPVAVNIDPVDGGVVVAGNTYTVDSENDLHTIRYDSAGNVVWQRTLYRPDNDDFAVDMVMDLSGNAHILADTNNGTDWDIHTVQYDHTGKFINGTIYAGVAGGDDAAYESAVNMHGEVFIAGYTENASLNPDYLVVKLDGDELQSPIPFEDAVHYVTIDFTWQDNSEDETSYQLQRNANLTTCDGAWVDIYNSTGTSYTDDDGGPPGLASGTLYCYRLRTYKSPTEFSRWLTKDLTTVVLPEPSGLTATAVNSTDINLSWTDTTTSETVFNIDRCDASGAACPGADFANLDTITAPDTPGSGSTVLYTDSTACEGEEYYYRVNAEKTTTPVWTSGWSNEDNATTIDINQPAYTPTDLTTSWVSEVQIDLEWTDNTIDETGFKVERCLTSSCVFSQIDTVGLDSNIIMLLNMDEGGWVGTTDEVVDSTVYNNDGVAKNGANTVSGGKYGYAASFDGSDDYVEVPHNPGLRLQDELSIELWFKPAITYDSSLTDYVVLVDRQWSAGTDSYFLGINSDGKLHMGTSGGSIQSTQSTWTAGTWYHVVVTYRDVATVYSGEMYVDGALETLSVDSYDNMSGGIQKIGVGGSDRYDNFEGIIDKVAIYNYTLTDSEADDRFNNKVRYLDASVPTADDNYTYQIRAYKTADAVCGGEWNSEYSSTAADDSTIEPPSDLTATTVNTTRIDLTWTDNTASETGFKIYRCDGSCTPDTNPVGGDDLLTTEPAAAGQGTTATYSDEVACQGLTYSYSIVATKTATWDSLPSSPPVSATTETAFAPGAISLIDFTESQVELEWTDNTDDETGYKIERCKDTLLNCTASFVVDGTTTVSTLTTGQSMMLHMDELLWDNTPDEVTDSSGSGNDGVSYNDATTDAGGRLGRAGTFDGSGDYLQIPHSTTLEGSGDFTLELWVKPIDYGSYQSMLSKGGYRYLFALNDSGSNYRLAYYGSGWQYGDTYTPYNEWNHVAVTFDGTDSITFYLNGKPDGTRTIAANQTSNAALLIGQWGNGNLYKGLMDEVAVYDRVLTEEEILTRYWQGLSSIAQGIATSGSTTTVVDTSQSWDAAGNGEWENYYVYMETGASIGETRQITSNTSDTLTVGIAFTNPVATNDVYRIVRAVDGLDSTGLIPSTTYTYRTRAYKTAAGCSGGEWNSDASDLVEVTTTAPEEPAVLTAETINTTEVRLDWEDNTTSETDFEIERRCTSGDDCQAPYDDWYRINIDGDPGSNDADNASYFDDDACENTSYDYRVNAKNPSWVPTTTIWSNIDSITTDDMMAPSGLVAETVTEEQIDLTWIDNTGDETNFKIERCNDTLANCTASFVVDDTGTLGTSYGNVLLLHMDEASWGTVLDSSEGGNNNGTAYNGVTTDPEGKFGRAGSFNGSNQYVTTPLNLDQSETSAGVTMSAWVKPSSTSSNWHHVISTSDDGVEWSLVRNAGNWRVLTGSSNFNSGLTVDVGEWQHIAAVFEPGVGITVYKNGAAASTASIGYNTDDRNVFIGRRSRDNNYFFDGLIDEVAVFSSPLSFAEIYQLDVDEWKEETGAADDGDLDWLEDNSKSWTTDEWVDYYVRYTSGDISGESAKILSNTGTRLNVEPFSDYAGPDDPFEIITYLKGTASGGSTTTVIDSDIDGKNWTVDEWANHYVIIETGNNIGKIRKIISNTFNTLTVEAFSSNVINGNAYKIIPYLQGVQSYGTKDSGNATSGTTTTVVDTAKAWSTNEWQNLYVLMETGSNAGELSQITSNTADTLTVGTAFTNPVVATDLYKIVTSQDYTKRYSDTGLEIGQTYSYRVRGYKDASCLWPVEYSNIAASTISPPAPSNFTATSGGTTQIALEWTDNTETETGFKIYRCDGTCTPDTDPDGGDDLLVEIPGGASTGIRTYTDTAVAPGVCESQKYSYSIVATSSSPSWDSAASNVDDATADTAPAPDDFIASPYAESQIDLTWDDNTVDETGFKVYRCASPCTVDTDPAGGDDLLTIVETNLERFSDTGLAPNSGYNYEVHAYKTATCLWSKSDTVSGTTSTLAAPVLTATTVNTTRIDLDWTDANTSETGTEIFRCETDPCSPADPGDLITTVGPGVTSYSDPSLCVTTKYTYRLKPVNDGLSNDGGGCWTRRSLLDITDFQPNYPTKVTVDHTLFTGMQSDFSDLRFYDDTAKLEVPYWIQYISGDVATVYFKTMVNDDIYMYFNNASATSSSDGDRVYDFFDDFQGTAIDTEKWEEIDPYGEISQNDNLILTNSVSNSWNKALISQQTFDRVVGKEINISLTPINSASSDYFMIGWEKNQLTSPDQDNYLRHAFYWANGNLNTYEYWNTYTGLGSYTFGSNYLLKIVVKDSGAKYYIKGGTQFPAWTLVKETTTNADSPMRLAIHQYNAGANIHNIKVQNHATLEPSVSILVESGSGCFSFSSIWTDGPDSNEAFDTTDTPAAPSSLTTTAVTDTEMLLSWTDNTDDETGFKIERCTGSSCTPLPPEIASVQGYDPSLAMLLRMDETSWHGITGEVADSTGNGNNGTSYAGANTEIGGAADRAGRFYGVNEYVSVPNSTGISPTDEITVGIWAKSDTATWNATGTLLSKRDAYIMYPVSGGREIRFYVYTTGNWYMTTYTPADITGWHHYVGTYDGNEIKLYIDGSPVGTPTIRPGGINPDTGPLYIGLDDGQGRYFKGMIDEVTIYGSALSDSEVQSLYDQGVPSVTEYLDTVSPSASYCYQVRAYKTATGCTGGEVEGQWNSGYSSPPICTDTPPATPATLTATAVNSLVIRLDWDASGVNNELGFVIERKIWGGNFVRIATVGDDVETYNDFKGLESEQEYTYRVWAYNAVGDSDYSNYASEITPSWQEGDSTCP